ncbi:hypothetical protein JTE90_024339 [Oedothorax gibbosus]|uniref:Thyroglobulin type-1 domain-containing protein n=1 Tax=Oedothorax gibbosus TaxID=931172 RepID=A0AAV6W097_9ARAC|nr:hypothetical protein JTE90_024339 [Oedothorax gibbosus]
MFMWLCVFTVLSKSLQVGSISYDPEIFRCQTGFCENVNCEHPKNCKEGELERKASFCQCCDVCIKLLGEGEKCLVPLSGSLKEISTEKCQAGLICNNGVCQKVNTLTGCLKLKHIRESLIPDPNSTYADQIWIPDCMTNGAFRAKQQKKRKSICVDALGETIFGQLPPGLSENMTCECSRYMLHLEKEHPNTFMTKPQQHCSPSGTCRPSGIGDLLTIGDLHNFVQLHLERAPILMTKPQEHCSHRDLQPQCIGDYLTIGDLPSNVLVHAPLEKEHPNTFMTKLKALLHPDFADFSAS